MLMISRIYYYEKSLTKDWCVGVHGHSIHFTQATGERVNTFFTDPKHESQRIFWEYSPHNMLTQSIALYLIKQ